MTKSDYRAMLIVRNQKIVEYAMAFEQQLDTMNQSLICTALNAQVSRLEAMKTLLEDSNYDSLVDEF